MVVIGLRITFPKTFNLPLCGIPIINECAPNSLARSIASFNAGTTASPPSKPNRFEVLNLCAKNDSKVSAKHKRSKMCIFFSRSLAKKLGCSTRSRIQLHCCVDPICIYSTPMVPQYVSRRRSSTLRNVTFPGMLVKSSRKPLLPPVCTPLKFISLSKSFSGSKP